MADSWDSVTVIRKSQKNASALKSTSAVNSALRSGGAVITEKKTVGNQNKGGLDIGKVHKLENETEVICTTLIVLLFSNNILLLCFAHINTSRTFTYKKSDYPSQKPFNKQDKPKA